MSHINLDCTCIGRFTIPFSPGIATNPVLLLKGNMLRHATLPRSLLIFALLSLIGAADTLISASNPPGATSRNSTPNRIKINGPPTPGNTLTNQDVLGAVMKSWAHAGESWSLR